MQIPNKGIIDGDWLAYTAACYADNEGFDCLEDRIAYDIRDLSSSFEDIAVAFSCSRSDNFRRDFWPLYKSNREGKPKPQFLGDAVQMVRDRIEEVIEIPRLEADDIISMMVSSGEAVGIAIDKDMRTARHWNPRKRTSQ